MTKRSIYFSIDTLNRNNCEYLIKTYEKGKSIGSGAYGNVYEACKDKNCNYVLKVIKYKKDRYENSGKVEELSEKYIKKIWKKEILIHLKLNNCQQKIGITFSPLIHDAWHCKEKDETTFFIIMEKYDGNLTGFIEKYKSVKEKEVAKVAIDQALQKLYMCLTFIHDKCDICLNDIKLDNILYKKIKDYQYDFVFADFGKSTYKTTVECKKTDLERFTRNIKMFESNFKE
jgi:serine/threonine protein kinase